MSDPSPFSDETLERLKREREEADARYNEALTAVDRALHVPLPRPPRFDDARVGAIRDFPAIVAGDPLASLSGWRRRLAGFVWRLVGPIFQQQQQFNVVVADHLARNADGERNARLAVEQALGAVEMFHHALLRYLQQVTGFVESKDRETAGGAGRVRADLAGGLSGLADELAKRWESMVAREQRFVAREQQAETRAAELRAASAEMRVSIASLQRAVHAVRREMERLLASGAAVATVPATGEVPARPAAASLEAYKYVGFEDQFRGPVDEIQGRLREYLPYFEGAADVLDVGCGRGEFLRLLASCGVTARGVDLNHEMVETCRSQGLSVVEGDGLDYLASLADGSLGGLFASQVVEHLDPDRLLRLLDVAFGKLRPGSRIVLETINPACWAAFFESYIRDLTHVRPIHPDTLKYLLQASGFQAVEIAWRAPYPEAEKLQAIDLPPGAMDPAADLALATVADTFNGNVARLNTRLFTYRDYAAIATKL